MDVSVREFIRAAEREGWTAAPRPGGHYELRHPQTGGFILFSASPSDHHWEANTWARMRRLLAEAEGLPESSADQAKGAGQKKGKKSKPPKRRERPLKIETTPIQYHPTPPPPTQKPRPVDPELHQSHVPGAPIGYWRPKGVVR